MNSDALGGYGWGDVASNGQDDVFVVYGEGNHIYFRERAHGQSWEPPVKVKAISNLYDRGCP